MLRMVVCGFALPETWHKESKAKLEQVLSFLTKRPAGSQESVSAPKGIRKSLFDVEDGRARLCLA